MKLPRYAAPFRGLKRHGEKTVSHTLASIWVAALFMAWVITDLIFQLRNHIALKVKQSNKQSRKRWAVHDNLKIGFALTSFWTAIFLLSTAEQNRAQTILGYRASGDAIALSSSNIWQTDVGEGFKAGGQSFSLGLGAGYGLKILGSKESHDLALVSISYGQMVGSVKGQGHWYRGNWELRGELFTGAQFAPTTESLVGLTPHLRYYFATGTRWIPYFDAGAGVSATSISRPDLSGTFEFNLQGATGVQWFIRDNVALGIEARYLHMSCAGIHSPNLGLNNVGGMLSVSWFF